ncbi:MAG: HNH endonuclease [Symbiobacterium sp.]|uniref:HNH endonuclease n=1 Tax=Symbiobacterium sp. TaxID=1971213 RepID=UPI00346470BD
MPREGKNPTDLIEVIDVRGRTLTPCRREVAEREVRLGRARWVGRARIRLRFDPFAYRHIRLKVLARDRYTCYWCGRPGFTLDHVIPWSKGGLTTMDNCICACEECNGRRGDLDAAEFARRMGRPTPAPGKTAAGGKRPPVRFVRMTHLLESAPVSRGSLY